MSTSLGKEEIIKLVEIAFSKIPQSATATISSVVYPATDKPSTSILKIEIEANVPYDKYYGE